jgi:exopolyphosphatase/guanosine-5'-triphosphate,3'-diphosphate pyrophosphatase
MLWIKADEQPGSLKYSANAGTLELILKEAASPLFGEVAQARFDALAAALDVKGIVRVKGERRSKGDPTTD